MEVSASTWNPLQPDNMEMQYISQANGMQNMRSIDPTLSSAQGMSDISTQEALMQMSPVFDLSINDNMDTVFDINANPFVAGMPNANTTLMGDSFFMKSPESSTQDLDNLFDADFPHQFESDSIKNESQSLIAPMSLDTSSSKFNTQPLQLNTYMPFDSPPEASESDISWSLSSPESQQGFLDDGAGFLEMSALDKAIIDEPATITPSTQSSPEEPKTEISTSTKSYATRKRKESPLSAAPAPAPAAAKDQKQEGAPRKRRTRRSKPLSEEQKRLKHERFLANNREAACKCRQKKKAAENKLIDDAKNLEAAVEVRRQEYSRLQAEFAELKQLWDKHQGCPGIDHRASISGSLESIRATSPSSSSDTSEKPSRASRAKSLPI